MFQDELKACSVIRFAVHFVIQFHFAIRFDTQFAIRVCYSVCYPGLPFLSPFGFATLLFSLVTLFDGASDSEVQNAL